VLGAILIIVYVIACLFLIMVVLLQAGKGGGLGSAFGGAGAGSVFGGRGAATFLTRLTAIMAALFMILSVGISLNLAGGRATVSPEAVLDEEKKQAEDLAKQTAEKEAEEATTPAPSPAPAPEGKASVPEGEAPAEGAAPAPAPEGKAAPAEGAAPAEEVAPAAGAAQP